MSRALVRELTELKGPLSPKISVRGSDSGVVDDDSLSSQDDEATVRSELERRRRRLSGALGRSMPALHLNFPGGSSETEDELVQPAVPPGGSMHRNRSLYVGSSRRHKRMSAGVSPNASPQTPRSPLTTRLLLSGESSVGRTDLARTCSWERRPARLSLQGLLVDPTLPSTPTPHDRERIEAAFQKVSSNRTPSTRAGHGSSRTRARSLSPTRRSEPSPHHQMASFFKARLQTSIDCMTQEVQALLASLGEGRGDGSSDSGLIFEQLNLIARDLLDTASRRTPQGLYFRTTADSLGKLLQLARSDHINVHRIKKLLLMIAHPARLLECLEFSPDDSLSQNPLDEQSRDPDLLCLTSGNSHMPGYILSKLSTHFGSTTPGSGGGQASLKCVSGGLDTVASAAFLDLGRKPVKGDFEKIKLLSSGAYGSVYLSKHKETHELFAVKCLRKRDMANKNLVSQVMAERDILKFAHNPFVIQFICSFTTKESLYIVMEYAPGGDLAAYLKVMGCMEEKEARRYFAETVLAVEYIHEFGIVHRDLKPDNLIISKDGHIKLTDFGLSRIGLMNRTTLLYEEPRGVEMEPNLDTPLASAETFPFPASPQRTGLMPVSSSSSRQDPGQRAFHSTVLGTPDYIAPEVILGQGYGQAVDWWAMGIILYEFLCGQPPFMGDTVEQLFHATLENELSFPDDVTLTDAAQDLIQLLLEKDPAMRLGTPSSPNHVPHELICSGATDVKDHHFFAMTIDEEDGINWDQLLQEKACFVPDLEDELDTSYFDCRQDRYQPPSRSSSDASSSDHEDEINSSLGMSMFRNFSCVNINSSQHNSTSAGSLSPRRRSSIHNDLDNFDIECRSPTTLRSNKGALVPPSVRAVSSPTQSASSQQEAQLSTTPVITVLPPSQRSSNNDLPLSVGQHQTVDTGPLVASSTSIPVSPPPFPTPPSPSLSSSQPGVLRRLADMVDSTPSQMTTFSPPGAISLSPLRPGHRPSRESAAATSTKETLPGMPSALCLADVAAASSISPPSILVDPADEATIKVVTVAWSEQYGFGFGIRTCRTALGNRHRIVYVDPCGPAQTAGMQTHYAVIQVNTTKIQLTYSNHKVSRLINQCRGHATVFHLLDITTELTAGKRVDKDVPILRRIANSFSREGRAKKLANLKLKKEQQGDMAEAVTMAPTEPRWDWLSRFTRSPSLRASVSSSDIQDKKELPVSTGFISSLKRSKSSIRRKPKKGSSPTIGSPTELMHLGHVNASDVDVDSVKATLDHSTNILRSDSLRSSGSSRSRYDGRAAATTPIISSPLRSPGAYTPPSFDFAFDLGSGVARAQGLDDSLGRSPSPGHVYTSQSWAGGNISGAMSVNARVSLQPPPNSPSTTIGSMSPLHRSPPVQRRSPLTTVASPSASPQRSPGGSPKAVRTILNLHQQRSVEPRAPAVELIRHRSTLVDHPPLAKVPLAPVEPVEPRAIAGGATDYTATPQVTRLRSWKNVMAVADQQLSAVAVSQTPVDILTDSPYSLSSAALSSDISRRHPHSSGVRAALLRASASSTQFRRTNSSGTLRTRSPSPLLGAHNTAV